MNIFKIVVLVLAVCLSGCSSVRQLHTDVLTQSSLPTPPSAGYRFERLPSQQVPAQLQNQIALEAMAQNALSAVGMHRDDAKPDYSVQVHALVQYWGLSPWNDPWFGSHRWGLGLGAGMGGGLGAGYRRMGFGGGMYGGGYPAAMSSDYHREVGLVIRELQSGQVVYETRAVSDTAWTNDTEVLATMFQAAVDGFPRSSAQPRTMVMAFDPATTRPPVATAPAVVAPTQAAPAVVTPASPP